IGPARAGAAARRGSRDCAVHGGGAGGGPVAPAGGRSGATAVVVTRRGRAPRTGDVSRETRTPGDGQDGEGFRETSRRGPDCLGPGCPIRGMFPVKREESDPTLDRAEALGQHGATRARVTSRGPQWAGQTPK